MGGNASRTYDKQALDTEKEDKLSIFLTYFTICHSFLILLHSLCMHGEKISSTRQISDLCAFCALAVMMVGIPETMSQSDFATGTLYQGLGSIFFFGVYLFDSLIFINRYLAVYPRTSTCKKIGLYIYLSLQFVLWVPAFLFGPFIVDMSTPKANELMALLLVISSVLKTIFNATFSVVFFRMLLTYFRSPEDYRKRSYNYTVYLISLKSVIHFVTSVIAVALSAIFESNGSWRFSMIIIPNQIHFLFNYPIEHNTIVLAMYRLLFRTDSKISAQDYLAMDLDYLEDETGTEFNAALVAPVASRYDSRQVLPSQLPVSGALFTGSPSPDIIASLSFNTGEVLAAPVADRARESVKEDIDLYQFGSTSQQTFAL